VIRIERKPVVVDIPKLLEENLPYLQVFYTNQGELTDDAKYLFAHHIENAGNLPFYVLSQNMHAEIKRVSEAAYGKMVEALSFAFENRGVLKEVFACNMLSSAAGEAFIDYAHWTFQQRTMAAQPLYSRFDLAVDPVTEKVTGIYELNADTPTMLFESTALNDYLIKQHWHEDQQCNDWFANMTTTLAAMSTPGSINADIGVVFDSNAIDDSATCEIISQLLGEFSNAFMVDMKAMQYEDLRKSRPFEAYDIVMDGAFTLIPWEEMVVNHSKSILHWQNWCTDVALLNPAWTWFLSNKGIFALLTQLEHQGVINLDGLPFLKTAMYRSQLIGEGKVVRKPKVGRMSANVTILNNIDVALESTSGPYADEAVVYQEYQAPGRVNGDRNFIVGAWMAPEPIKDGKGATMSGIAIREFGDGINDMGDEQFIPHVVV
jgi:glutathionylspermidine synthase